MNESILRILIIEDEIKTAETLKKGLEENRFFVDIVFDGEMGLLSSKQNKYDLIISDINMPGINGFELCRRIREAGDNTPMIMLTAMSMTSDKIAGFEAGADQYMVKPFEFEELLARVKSVIKRSNQPAEKQELLNIADLFINLQTKEVVRAGRNIVLTAKEFSLLEYFIRNKGKVISRMDIAEKVWDINFDTGTNVIEVYVNYLRNKIDKGFDQKLIHTRVGMGYVLKCL